VHTIKGHRIGSFSNGALAGGIQPESGMIDGVQTDNFMRVLGRPAP
jgi:hypothetical protein